MKGVWTKLGRVAACRALRPWWVSHAMAPAPVVLADGRVRVFLGGWSETGIARIGWIDLAGDDPLEVLGYSEEPVVDLGSPGCFDDNGVFPAHVSRAPGGEILLYTTGFQLSTREEVDHFNFSGLAVSRDEGATFAKFSRAPVLDRADEGLHVRAGLSSLWHDGAFHCVYSAGTGFTPVGGKLRPSYEVFYQRSDGYAEFARSGRRIVALERSREHGLGRPQIVRMQGRWVVFYTRRVLDMHYHMGCSVSDDLEHWQRADDWLASVRHGEPGSFDHEMVYFPAVVRSGGRWLLFYSGNGYGRDGLGVAELRDA